MLYKSHIKVNCFIALPLAAVGLKYLFGSSTRDLLLFSASFAYATFFLHPDLDLAYKVPLFSWRGLFTLPFRPLSYFQKHRGLSHFPFLGTFLRFFWLYLSVLLLCSVLDISPHFLEQMAKKKFWLLFGGCAISDLSHIFTDYLWKK